jgi:hypothetical protein
MTQNLSKATSIMVREDMNTEVFGSVLINLDKMYFKKR